VERPMQWKRLTAGATALVLLLTASSPGEG